MRYEEFIKKAVDEVTGNSQIRLLDMPALDLYMDQVTTFMDKKLSAYKKTEKDIILSKTMINNYTKYKLIPKPINKKYNKDHLIFLILIYYMKRILSVQDMEKMMKPILDNYYSELDEKIDLQDLYSAIMEIQKNEKENLNKVIKEDVENVKESLKEVNLSDDDMLEIFTLIVTLTLRANMEKYMAEKLLNQFFTGTEKTRKVKEKKVKAKKENTLTEE